MTSLDGTASVNAPSVAIRSYLSTHHLWAGRHLAKCAAAIEAAATATVRFDIQHRAYAIGAILAAVAFAEAAVNELFQDIADGHLSYAAPLTQQARAAMDAYWRESEGRHDSIVKKYQLSLGLAGAQPLDPSAEPFQGFSLLNQLRNQLVHFRPETASAAEVQGLEKRLRGKFPENALMTGAGNPFFPDKCLGAGCANWAVATAKAFADETFLRLRVTPNYQRVGWDDQGNPVAL